MPPDWERAESLANNTYQQGGRIYNNGLGQINEPPEYVLRIRAQEMVAQRSHIAAGQSKVELLTSASLKTGIGDNWARDPLYMNARAREAVEMGKATGKIKLRGLDKQDEIDFALRFRENQRKARIELSGRREFDNYSPPGSSQQGPSKSSVPHPIKTSTLYEENKTGIRDNGLQNQIDRERKLQKDQEWLHQTILENNRLRAQRENPTPPPKIVTVVGDTLAGMVPPGIRRYAMRRPLDTDMLGAQGAQLVQKQADRTAWQVQMAMDDFNFWVSQAANIFISAGFASYEYIGTVGIATALKTFGNGISKSVSSSISSLSSTGVKVTSTNPKSIDQVLFKLRDEAYSITRKMVRGDFVARTPETQQRYGEIIDAIFKSLIQQAKKDGILPGTIKTAPPALVFRPPGGLPKGKVIDVWDTATGSGWDLTKATVKDVVKHEMYKGMAMPGGTIIKEVRPLVYLRGWE